jgi:5-methylcytosine-specific restriction endonuclease McrA
MSSTYIPAALRRLVYDRAEGCCEYCLTPEAAVFASHEIDHIMLKNMVVQPKLTTWRRAIALCSLSDRMVV